MRENKIVYFEAMRILACALVLFNHLPAYSLFYSTTGKRQFLYMCMSMITRINVPLFFMISGALLLEKNEEWTYVFKKRFIRVALLLLFFSFILYSLFKLKNVIYGTEYEYTLLKFLYGFLNDQMEGVMDVIAYWYLYSYLGLLFVLPLIQRIAKGFTRTEFFALLILHFIISSLFPLVNILLSIRQLPPLILTGRFSEPFAVDRAFFYPLIGYYLDKKLDIYKVSYKHIVGMVLTAATGIILSDLCTYFDAGQNGVFSQNYVMLFDYVTSIVAFILIKYFFVVSFPKLNSGKSGRIICFMGSMTLGIYLWDPCLKISIYEKYEAYAESVLSTILVSLGWIVISMVFGTLLTLMLRKIPFIRKLV
ncbi:MAG: acyltransferase [Lachnospiraceae bacterium]|nr:acyltransferase [Lachnospiraceae bacterium]